MPDNPGDSSRLKVYRNGKILRNGVDFKISPELDTLWFPDTVGNNEEVCLVRFVSPLIPYDKVVVRDTSQFPVKSDSIGFPRELSSFERTTGINDHGEDAATLDYGGTQTISVAAGEGGGFVLDQSLFLNVNGQLSENVMVEGHLSDQDIPIQPEGNTATIREVDRKYIRIFGRNYDYVLGDFSQYHGRQNWDGYFFKGLGPSLKFSLDDYKLEGHYAQSYGQFHNNTFQGEDGRQGGYYLVGKGGNQFITVLAGSETIRKNGVKMERGHDYVIDYSEGRIDFLKNVRVSSENQFNVEFQYTEQDYPLAVLSAGVADTQGVFQWSLRQIGEWEDGDHPLLGTRDDQADRIFRAIGDGPPPSSLGQLSPPESQRNAVLDLNFTTPDLKHKSSASLQYSNHDQNTLSPYQDWDNNGLASQYFATQILGDYWKAGGVGVFEMNFTHLYLSPEFSYFHQALDQRTYRDEWNLPAEWAEQDFSAHTLTTAYKPMQWMTVGAEGGLARGEHHNVTETGLLPVRFSSRKGRIFANAGPDVNHRLEMESGAKLAQIPYQSDNYRQRVIGNWEIGKFSPDLIWQHDEWISRPGESGFLHSHKFEEGLGLEWRPVSLIQSNSEWKRFRFLSNFSGKETSPTDSVQIWELFQSLELFAVGNWTSEASYSYQEKKQWPETPGGVGNQYSKSDFHSAEWTNSISDASKGYYFNSWFKMSRESDFPLLAVYDSVGAGAGDYRRDELFSNEFHYDPENGTHILAGWARDTLAGRSPYTETELNLDLGFDPEKWKFIPAGFLSDVELDVEILLSRQDTLGDLNPLPPFFESHLDGYASGLVQYSPRVRWNPAKLNHSGAYQYRRFYEKRRGFRAAREKSLSHDLNYQWRPEEKWEILLSPEYEKVEFLSLTSAQFSRHNRYSGNGEVVRSFLRNWNIALGYEQSYTDGETNSGQVVFNKFRPLIRIQKQKLWNGALSMEYSLHHVNGRGEGSYLMTEGYDFGTTHRLQTDVDIIIKEFMHFHLEHIYRRDPDNSNIQRMSGEMRASF